VIAIGRPGESLPPLGAARLWVSNDEWQARVMELLGKCQRVVMIMGEIEGKPGLTWEFQRLLEFGSPEKVVFVVPPVSEEVAAERWKRYQELSLGKLPPYQGREVVARFDAQGTCHVTHGPAWKRGPQWRDEEGYVQAFEKIGLARAPKRGWGCAMAAGACLVLFIGFLFVLTLLDPPQPPEALSDSEVERLVRDIATFEQVIAGRETGLRDALEHIGTLQTELAQRRQELSDAETKARDEWRGSRGGEIPAHELDSALQFDRERLADTERRMSYERDRLRPSQPLDYFLSERERLKAKLALVNRYRMTKGLTEVGDAPGLDDAEIRRIRASVSELERQAAPFLPGR
jgi:hypothetical protein